MYGRLIRVNFKDEMTKDMILNYSDNKADKIGFEKYGLLQKLWLDTSKSSATLLLIFPNIKQCQIDHENHAKEFIGGKIEFLCKYNGRGWEIFKRKETKRFHKQPT